MEFKPASFGAPLTCTPSDFFRARIDAMIDLRAPLAVLATPMPWAQIETFIAPHLQRKLCTCRQALVHDLFGTTLQIAGAGVSPAGRPRLSGLW